MSLRFQLMIAINFEAEDDEDGVPLAGQYVDTILMEWANEEVQPFIRSHVQKIEHTGIEAPPAKLEDWEDDTLIPPHDG